MATKGGAKEGPSTHLITLGNQLRVDSLKLGKLVLLDRIQLLCVVQLLLYLLPLILEVLQVPFLGF